MSKTPTMIVKKTTGNDVWTSKNYVKTKAKESDVQSLEKNDNPAAMSGCKWRYGHLQIAKRRPYIPAEVVGKY